MPFDWMPTFNSINDRQYIRPTYVDPETGLLSYNNPAMNPPAAVTNPMPPVPMPAPTMPGQDFFAQLAGLFSQGGMGAAPQPRPYMGAQDALARVRQMGPVTGYGTPGGQGRFGGVSREGQRAMFEGQARALGRQQQQPSAPRFGSGRQVPMAPKGPARVPQGLLPMPKQPGRFGAPSQVFDKGSQSRTRNMFGRM